MSFIPKADTKKSKTFNTNPPSNSIPEYMTTTYKTQESVKKINELFQKANTHIKSYPTTNEAKFPINSSKNFEDKNFRPEKQNQQLVQNSKIADSISRIFKKTYKSQVIQDSLGLQSDYTHLIESSNLSEALIRSLQLNEILVSELETHSKPDPENEPDDITQLMSQTKQLETRISLQKQKISTICRNLDTSFEKSKTFLSSFESSLSPQSFSQKE